MYQFTRIGQFSKFRFLLEELRIKNVQLSSDRRKLGHKTEKSTITLSQTVDRLPVCTIKYVVDFARIVY